MRRNIADVEEVSGKGIRAICDGETLLVGNRRMMIDGGIETDESHEGGTAVYVAMGGRYLGRIIISDSLKADTRSAVDSLMSMGIKNIVMLTGDCEREAERVASQIGIGYRAELLPQDKVVALERVMSESVDGKTVFVGDGINDAPVIARTDIGISMGALGSDAAVEASDIVLIDDNLKKLPYAIKLSRRTRAIVIQNITFALAIKAAALIFGALGFVGLGVAVFADVGVAVIAILNSMRNLKK